MPQAQERPQGAHDLEVGQEKGKHTCTDGMNTACGHGNRKRLTLRETARSRVLTWERGLSPPSQK